MQWGVAAVKKDRLDLSQRLTMLRRVKIKTKHLFKEKQQRFIFQTEERIFIYSPGTVAFKPLHVFIVVSLRCFYFDRRDDSDDSLYNKSTWNLFLLHSEAEECRHMLPVLLSNRVASNQPLVSDKNNKSGRWTACPSQIRQRGRHQLLLCCAASSWVQSAPGRETVWCVRLDGLSSIGRSSSVLTWTPPPPVAVTQTEQTSAELLQSQEHIGLKRLVLFVEFDPATRCTEAARVHVLQFVCGRSFSFQWEDKRDFKWLHLKKSGSEQRRSRMQKNSQTTKINLNNRVFKT